MQLPLPYLHRPSADPEPWLLVLLHGVGSNEEDMFGLAPTVPARFHVLSLRAPYEIAQGAYGWFTFQQRPDGSRRIDALQERESRFLVGALAQSAAGQLGVPTQRLIVGGFSQGGIMSLSVLLTHPALVRGAMVMHSRLLPEIEHDIAPAEAFRGKSLWVSHGSADRMIPPSEAQGIRHRASALQIELAGADFPAGHQIHPAEWAQATAWLGMLEG